jgi:hypothetical protein
MKVVRGRTDKWHAVEYQSWSGGIRSHCGFWFVKSQCSVWPEELIEGEGTIRCRRCFR